MTPSSPTRLRSVLLKANAAVIGVAVICLAFVAPVAYRCSGPIGMQAAALASASCCIGALGSLCAAPWLRNPNRLLLATLMGMTVRMGVSLSSAMVVQLVGGPLVEAGFLYYLLLFYMLTLVVETAVVVRSWST